jgi:hypothetical protein
MAAYRCSMCNLNYRVHATKCKVCEGPLSWMANAQPTDEAEISVMLAHGRPPEGAARDYLHEHRVERFLELGFSEVNAELLALAKDAKGFSRYWGDVAKALDAGVSHEQAIAVFT